MRLTYERKLWSQGYSRVLGLDEAGRGSWAGPLVVAGVVLPSDFKVRELDDSKKLSSKKREELYQKIKNEGEVFVACASSKTIDKEGVLVVTKKLMRKAAREAKANFLLIDAVNLDLPGVPQLSVLQGDCKIASVAAASIVAKVERDFLMLGWDKKHPLYGFRRHKGYGTKEHQKALVSLGPCFLHRRTYRPIQKLLAKH